jgi:L-glyceraldehyde 3-phosphate reductase
MENYVASDKRYDAMRYVRCGRSGVLLPQVSLGMWHNFGGIDDYQRSRSILRHAFDRGITHLDYRCSWHLRLCLWEVES